MRIGELASQAGVSVRALRYYEEQGLLTAERSASGQRVYPDNAVEQVKLIQNLYAAGLASRAIEPIMPCVRTGEVTPELLDRLMAERARIEERIGGLVETRDKLDAIILVVAESLHEGRPCPRD
ncbi:MerR family transcriptional regulator [Nonomuraea candida]|uniref:MerR family transcriptional regulator n=1 Tax=Nonomuraea candida TaxID=359159 RepID=UPI0005BC3CF5|nr:MerR family transcriptional regulator [Nonomuraea candida]